MPSYNVDAFLQEDATTRIVCLSRPEHLELVPELAYRAKIAEYRYDYEGMHDPQLLIGRLQHVGRHMGLLFTNRWSGEGGRMTVGDYPLMNESDRGSLLKQVAPYVDAVDIEIDAPGADGMQSLARKGARRIPTIASYHDFSGESSAEDWDKKIVAARENLSPHWIKIAVQLDSQEALDEFTGYMTYHRPPEVIAVGMGKYGRIARMIAIRLGLPAVYCTPEPDHQNAQVPGQLTLDMADEADQEYGITAHPGAIAA